MSEFERWVLESEVFTGWYGKDKPVVYMYDMSVCSQQNVTIVPVKVNMIILSKYTKYQLWKKTRTVMYFSVLLCLINSANIITHVV